MSTAVVTSSIGKSWIGSQMENLKKVDHSARIGSKYRKDEQPEVGYGKRRVQTETDDTYPIQKRVSQ